MIMPAITPAIIQKSNLPSRRGIKRWFIPQIEAMKFNGKIIAEKIVRIAIIFEIVDESRDSFV